MSQGAHQTKHGNTWRKSAIFCCHVFAFSGRAAAFFAATFVLFAFFQILLGIAYCGYTLVAHTLSGDVFRGEKPGDHAYMVIILHGFELLLISPLPFLILSSLASFVWDLGHEGVISNTSRAKLEASKLLLYGIFFGIICLDLISKAISGKIVAQHDSIEVAIALSIVVFLFGLEIISIFREKGKADSKGQLEPGEKNDAINKIARKEP